MAGSESSLDVEGAEEGESAGAGTLSRRYCEWESKDEIGA
jgi:hypothetical protein